MPGLIPTYLVVQKLDLIDTYWAVILPGGINIYNLLVMKSFFEGLPDELKEAARLDGANELQVLWHVILPLIQAHPVDGRLVVCRWALE